MNFCQDLSFELVLYHKFVSKHAYIRQNCEIQNSSNNDPILSVPAHVSFRANLSARIMTVTLWKIEERGQAFEEIMSGGIPFDIPLWGPSSAELSWRHRFRALVQGVCECASLTISSCVLLQWDEMIEMERLKDTERLSPSACPCGNCFTFNLILEFV